MREFLSQGGSIRVVEKASRLEVAAMYLGTAVIGALTALAIIWMCANPL